MASVTNLAEGSQTLLKAISSLHISGEDSDVSIQCDDKKWPVHKFIIRAHSSVLAKFLNMPWERDPILLPEDEPCVVKAMIDFMYTADYSDTLGVANDIGQTEFNVLVYILADKFDIQPLAQLASSKFKTEANVHWETDDFALAIRQLYSSAPEKDQGMRDTAVGIATMHAKELLSKPYCEFQQVLEELKVFCAAFNVSIKHSESNIPPGSNTYFCAQAKKLFYLLGDFHNATVRCPHCGNYSTGDRTHPQVLGAS